MGSGRAWGGQHPELRLLPLIAGKERDRVWRFYGDSDNMAPWMKDQSPMFASASVHLCEDKPFQTPVDSLSGRHNRKKRLVPNRSMTIMFLGFKIHPRLTQ